MEIHPIYSEFFSDSRRSTHDWDKFKSKAQDLDLPAQADFSITTESALQQKSWMTTARKTSLILLKIVLFPWGLYSLAKAATEYALMRVICPAILHNKNELDILRKSIIENLNKKNLVIRDVTLEKNGIRYSGLLVGNKSFISNGKWALHAGGNNAPIEHLFVEESGTNWINPFLRAKFNVLLMNGPSVGRSQGSPTPDSLGETQELGISFLEEAVKAKKIVLSGQSLGGASIGKAILDHDFKSYREYLVLRMMTFDRLSNIANKQVGRIGKWVLYWLGYEMDSVEASKKLQKHQIHEVIFQAEKDKIMKGVTLLDSLKKERVTKNKTFQILTKADHNYLPYTQIEKTIRKWDQATTPTSTFWNKFFNCSAA